VNELRRNILEGLELMTQRKSNSSYWKKLESQENARVKAFSKKYGISVDQARLELQLRSILAEEDLRYLIEEGLRYDPEAVYNRREEE
jgi:hypothetical protein